MIALIEILTKMSESNGRPGIFTISLDFELFWGVRDKVPLERYRQNLEGVHKAIPAMLDLFAANDVHATWAAVGFLFFSDLDDLKNHLPARKPNYRNSNLSPYPYLENAGSLDPTFHFAPDLIDLIRKTPGQEIATHTFSHYYCLEEGQTLVDFEADLAAAIEAAARDGIAIRSLIFPRNQSNPLYLETAANLGIECVRGNESSWIYEASDDDGQHPFRRIVRLLDAYVNLSGHHTHTLRGRHENRPFDFPASRFLRPYSRKLAWADGARLRRITRAMDDAAEHGRLFHLWWHPHNFGVNLAENLDFLGKIIDHYRKLRDDFEMKSMTMCELCDISERTHAH